MNQPDAQTMPNYVTCPCQYCSGKIEFDANQLDAENPTVPCPHCGLETIIFVPEQKVPPVISDESINLKHPSEKFFDSSKSASDAKFQYHLGITSIREKDYAYAVKCFAKAAEQGYPLQSFHIQGFYKGPLKGGNGKPLHQQDEPGLGGTTI